MATRNAVSAAIAPAAMLLVLVSNAEAAEVVHQRFSSDTGALIDSSTCDFEIEYRIVAEINDALHHDENGNLTRVLETVRHMVTTYSANGRTLEGRGTGGFDVRFESNVPVSASAFGVNLKMTLPGRGVVFLDAGRMEVVYDPAPHVVFQAGPQRYDVGAFCDALSTG